MGPVLEDVGHEAGFEDPLGRAETNDGTHRSEFQGSHIGDPMHYRQEPLCAEYNGFVEFCLVITGVLDLLTHRGQQSGICGSP